MIRLVSVVIYENLLLAFKPLYGASRAPLLAGWTLPMQRPSSKAAVVALINGFALFQLPGQPSQDAEALAGTAGTIVDVHVDQTVEPPDRWPLFKLFREELAGGINILGLPDPIRQCQDNTGRRCLSEAGA